MKTISVDCNALENRDAFHNILAEALDFPEWYGRNLDALHDLLTAISEETHLVFQTWEQAEAMLGNYAKAARRVLTHAVSRNPNLIVEFQ